MTWTLVDLAGRERPGASEVTAELVETSPYRALLEQVRALVEHEARSRHVT